MERLLSEAIARSNQALTPGIPNDDGKHANKPSKQPGAPFAVTVDDHFGVTGAAEPIACGAQLRANLAKIVDRAIEYDVDRPCQIMHGLTGCRRRVEYGETSVCQNETTIGPASLAIRPAMPQRLGHRQTALA